MSKLRQSARLKECQIRVPGVCNGDPDKTVLCHLAGGGMGHKTSDIHAAYGCSSCHDEVDRRTHHIKPTLARLYHLDAVIRTQRMMLSEGLITHM
jgi:hypothetical protein